MKNEGMNIFGKILLFLGIISLMFGYFNGFYDNFLWSDGSEYPVWYNMFVSPFTGVKGAAAAFNMAMVMLYLISGAVVLITDSRLSAIEGKREEDKK